MNRFFNLIKFYQLENYFNILLKHNLSNDAPYHNLYHTLCVMENASLCLTHEEENKFTKEQRRNTLIASLFHDFNHSKGKDSDDINVQTAIDSFLKYSLETEENNNFIIDIIKATQYPYVINEEILTIFQKIIRDADLLQLFRENYIQQNIIGLSTEMNKPIEEFLNSSLSFYKNIKFHTKYGKIQQELHLSSIIEDVEFMIYLFQENVTTHGNHFLTGKPIIY